MLEDKSIVTFSSQMPSLLGVSARTSQESGISAGVGAEARIKCRSFMKTPGEQEGVSFFFMDAFGGY